uniref:glutathione transferase n=1 Tax=Plectus sambesii TaxID=2011161 RepID=A0A914X5Z3_9BILA
MFYGPIAIARFLAETYDLVSDDDDAWLCAQMDSLVEIYEGMCKEILLIRRQPKHSQEEAWQDFKNGKLIKLMAYFSQTLRNNDTNWLVGKQVTWADLAISDFFAFLVDKYDSTLLFDCPAIIKHIESIRAIPDIAEYISSRTELTK